MPARSRFFFPHKAVLQVAPSRPSNVVGHPYGNGRARASPDTTLFEHFERYLHEHILSPATIRNYLADLRAFSRWLAECNSHTAPLTRADFRAYRVHLCKETEHSTATVNRRLQSLRTFGRFLQESGRVAENPASDIELIHSGNGNGAVPHTLTPLEIKRLIAAVQEGRPSLRHRDCAILQLMLQAGLRVHEVAAMRTSDLITTSRGMRVEVGGNSGNGHRIVPLNAIAARALREYLAVRRAIPQADHLFLSQRGRSLSMRSIQRLIDNCARAAGLEGVSAQALRHTCAKTMLENTRDAALVARWLGHRDARALDKYAVGK